MGRPRASSGVTRAISDPRRPSAVTVTASITASSCPVEETFDEGRSEYTTNALPSGSEAISK
jgi:hypothetical protein